MKTEFVPAIKTGFYVSILSYAFFAFADYLRPGFVSNIFSVHLFLLAGLVFGILWMVVDEEDVQQSSDAMLFILKNFVHLLLGATLAFILWKEGGAFGDFRILISLLGFLLPWTLSLLLKPKS